MSFEDLEEEFFGGDDSMLASSCLLDALSTSQPFQAPQAVQVPPPLPPQLQQPPVVDPNDNLLAQLGPSAASEWHAAAVAWEGIVAEQRLAEQLNLLAARGNKTPAAAAAAGAPRSRAASTTTPAAAAAAAGRMKLECVRRVDEVQGVHRRAKEREMAAARVVAPLIEAAHGWHGGSTNDDDDDDGGATSRKSSSSSGPNLRSSFSFRYHSSRGTGSGASSSSSSSSSSSANSGENASTPLRMLFGGVAQGEPRGERDELQLKAAFGAASHSRAERVDLLGNYLQVVLRVPPAQLSSPGARLLWGRCGPRLGASHSLGCVAGALVETLALLYEAPLQRARDYGCSARPAVDYITADVKEVRRYFASLLLWKWEALFHEATSTSSEDSNGHGSSSGGPTSNLEASRLIAEALDSALLPLLPCVHALHSAQCATLDEWLCCRLGELARLPADNLCELLGLREDFRLDLCHRNSDNSDHMRAGSTDTSYGNSNSNSNSSNGCVSGLEGTMYTKALAALRKVGASLSSTAKVAAIASACREVCSAVGAWHQTRALKDFDAQLLQTNSVPATATAIATATANAVSSNGYRDDFSSNSSDTDNGSKASGSTRSNEEVASARAACVLKARSKGQLAADDMLPILQLLLVFGAVTEPHGGALRHLGAEGQYMEAFLPDHLASAEPGYCLVLFQTAVAALQEVASTHAEDVKSARMAQEALRRSQAADKEIAAVERAHCLHMEGDGHEGGDDDDAISKAQGPATRPAFEGLRGAVWRETGELEGAWAESPFTSLEEQGDREGEPDKEGRNKEQLSVGESSSQSTGRSAHASTSSALVASLICDSGLGLQDFQQPTSSATA